MIDFDELIDKFELSLDDEWPDETGCAAENVSIARTALTDAISAVTSERDKWVELEKTRADLLLQTTGNRNIEMLAKDYNRLKAKLAEANGFIDDLGDFLPCVDQPHDLHCAHYRNDDKSCDCEYSNLLKRFVDHRARLAKDES